MLSVWFAASLGEHRLGPARRRLLFCLVLLLVSVAWKTSRVSADTLLRRTVATPFYCFVVTGGGTMVTFQAFFDSPAARYQPGDMVTGRVRLLLTHTVTLRGIELMFRGHSSVHWMESKYETDENNRSQSVNIPYTSEELHYHMKFFVFGDAYAGNILHAGEYNFNFTTQIPPNIPSSFEGEFGFIRHEMTILSYPTIGNAPTTYLLNVVNPLNLNNEPNIRSAVRVMDEKTLCCCCCASNPISCALFLPASGFGIGQDIPMTVEVDNLSGKVVKGVSVTLQRVDTFTAVRPERGTRKKTHKLVVLQLESVPRRRSCTWERNISVPDGPPSGLKYCSIISSEYLISMEVQLPAPHINMTINTPIIVGNIPLVLPGPPLPCSLPPNSLIGNFNSSDPPPPYPYPVPSAPIIP